MTKQGILLINLGTPDHCDTRSVRRYLTEFLNDPRVIDLPRLIRWALVNLIIIPFRAKQSAHAYQTIWQTTGSPLLTNTIELKEALAKQLGPTYQVEVGMRYGKPSIPDAIKRLEGCDTLFAIPLFPQYSSAATGSALEKLLQILSTQWNIPSTQVIKDFYHQTGYIQAYADIIQQHLQNQTVDALIFSYHGLPERHITKSNCQAACDRVHACPAMNDQNAYCYRAQCYATSTLLAKTLNLNPDQYHVAFQSRLGRTPWIKPYTDLLLPQLIQQGKKNIAIVCPSFVSDCLETLEEINLRAREQWRDLGGNEFIFIPCLNAHPSWVKTLADIIQQG